MRREQDFAKTGLLGRYLAEREQFFKGACCFVPDSHQNLKEQQHCALQHAYQQSWINISEFQHWSQQLDL
ncbi:MULTISPECIES: hypothetical protein [unclassified Agarivorans]|uniref:hypothetical protein n=1 Tax=unclassified Agarivorans TaxID=2636026 RepID=UPI0010D6251E|nr:MULTISPECIES: hypothetical protein [unclassified Agarivorans]MDO6687846.1 hypothetical protein [Agarivorans sp. 3_MG-2023]MDO6717468.1 hypothetical protein [Agarivorans sp. 2_MG-2023]MDO6763192.1 hypothetical protein [Agarivorans sp. 1_MG-2023]GDY27023.1 hypothetical protein AHAT_29130 [Agarivorans sp. Toyoura001]